LPRLLSRESSNRSEQNNDAQFNQNAYDYRRKTTAIVYYDEPNGKRTIIWSKEALRITKSQEIDAILKFSTKSGDELSLAKLFVKAVKSLK
jgi:hypothetical protein